LSEKKTWGSEPYWGPGKRALAGKLLAQAAEDEAKEPIGR
jgi:hypothetical protein